jgi:hypothetical protein
MHALMFEANYELKRDEGKVTLKPYFYKSKKLDPACQHIPKLSVKKEKKQIPLCGGCVVSHSKRR